MWKIGRIDHVVLWSTISRDRSSSTRRWLRIDRNSYAAHKRAAAPSSRSRPAPTRGSICGRIELAAGGARGRQHAARQRHDRRRRDIQIVIDENARRGVQPDFPPGIQAEAARRLLRSDNNRIEMACRRRRNKPNRVLALDGKAPAQCAGAFCLRRCATVRLACAVADAARPRPSPREEAERRRLRTGTAPHYRRSHRREPNSSDRARVDRQRVVAVAVTSNVNSV